MKNYVFAIVLMTALSLSNVCCADAAKADSELVEVSVNFNGKNYKGKIPQGFDLVKHREYAPGFDKCMASATVRYDSLKCYSDAKNFLLNKLKAGFQRAKKACSDSACVNGIVTLQKAWLDHKNHTYDFLTKYVAVYGYTSELPFEFELDELVQQNKVLNTIGESLEDFAK